MTRALEVALYRTYCVPSISALPDRTGEFYKRTQKRYDGTLQMRDVLVRFFPARTKPNFFADRRNSNYPRGCAIAKLGPPSVDDQSHSSRATDDAQR